MPVYAYRAVDAGGARRRGVVEAPTAAAARATLRDRALLPLSLDEASARSGWPALRFGRGAIGTKGLATFTRQIATLVEAGIGVEEALRIVAAESAPAALHALLNEIRDGILDGRGFADALGRRPDAFPDYYRASVAAGEQSGKLAEVLLHLADFVEGRHRNRQTVQLALLYPALLGLVSLGMLTMLLVYVVPTIVRVFVSRGADLPFLTRALIAASALVRGWGVPIAIAVLLAFVIARRWLALPANQLRFDRALAATRFSRQHNAARFAASLATLVNSGVPLVDAICAAAAVTSNRYLRSHALGIAERVRAGASLRAGMAESGVFPPMLVAIVASGESGGRLGPALARAASELERELDALTATIVGLVEPAVLLVMGGLVLLMVLAILLPIIRLNDLVAL